MYKDTIQNFNSRAVENGNIIFGTYAPNTDSSTIWSWLKYTKNDGIFKKEFVHL